MRIAVGQLWQETNSFNRSATRLADFERWGVGVGRSVIDSFGDTGELSGFLGAIRAWRPEAEVVGLARFACWPWGAVDRATWSHIQSTFAERLRAAGKLDAVFLALHGAIAADGEPDVTGALLAQVRQAVGGDVPIVGTLDLHANVTRQMLAAADVLCGYHACPHLDSVETGARAAAALRTMLERGTRPVTHWRKLPMITAAEGHDTFTGPPAPLYRRLAELEQRPGVLSAGLYMVMPWLDAPALGWALTLTAMSDGGCGPEVLDELAGDCWSLRHTMESVERHPPDEVVDRAVAILEQGRHPVVIGDGADATNSGAPGDSTTLLRAFLSRDAIPHGALTFLVDPESVALAWNLGTGSTFDALVGAAYAPEHSPPIPFRGRIKRLQPVEFRLDGHISRNLPIRMGRGAVVRSTPRTTADEGVTVLFVEQTGPGSTPRLYEAAGLDPRTFGIVVAKSPVGFRADYRPFAAGILLADCPGCASPDWPRQQFHRVDHPLWPLDAIDSPHQAGWCESGRVS